MKSLKGTDATWHITPVGNCVHLRFDIKIFSFTFPLTPEQAKMFAAKLERAADYVQKQEKERGG